MHCPDKSLLGLCRGYSFDIAFGLFRVSHQGTYLPASNLYNDWNTFSIHSILHVQWSNVRAAG